MIPTGKAIVAGVIGWPVAHSLSPRIHGYWLDQNNIDGVYLPLAVMSGDLEIVLRALPKMGFAGVNVTLPHKEGAFAAVDHHDDIARETGAVNTVTVGNDGLLYGSNTDGFGVVAHLRDSIPTWDSMTGPVAVLGAGGAARGVCAGLVAAGVPKIRITNRTPDRAQNLADELTGQFEVVEWSARGQMLEGVSLLINTTSLGMTGMEPLDLDIAALPNSAAVYDIVYAPLETPLLAAARAAGHPTVDGLGMLLHQARPGFAAWFGVEPEVTPALRDFVLAT